MARWWKISAILLILGGGVYLGYQELHRWHQRALEDALEREEAKNLVERAKLKKRIGDLERELDLEKDAVLPERRLEEVFGKDAEAVLSTGKDKDCEELRRQVREFFSYLDETYHLKERNPQGGAFSLFLEMVGTASGALPLITGEMKDAHSLAKNVAHFYRALGKDQVRLVRDILRQEQELIEPVGALLFEWSISGSSCKTGQAGGPTLEVLYEYAAFFLNALAGKSYLMRRDSLTRVLVTYYCVLVVDRANEQMLNRHGVDILPCIEFSLSDVRTHRGLVSRMKYLKQLEDLQRKYARDRNGEE